MDLDVFYAWCERHGTLGLILGIALPIAMVILIPLILYLLVTGGECGMRACAYSS